MGVNLLVRGIFFITQELFIIDFFINFIKFEVDPKGKLKGEGLKYAVRGCMGYD